MTSEGDVVVILRWIVLSVIGVIFHFWDWGA